ncbi:MAG: TIGR03915 family putative DNA repair protein [Aurantibacter sp.]
MGDSKILIYDGSFNGFLTAIFVAFDERVQVCDIQGNSAGQNGLFSDTRTIFTQMDRARRVWNGIQTKSNPAIKNIYFAFLSESKGVELLLYRYIRKLFSSKGSTHTDHSDGIALKIGQLAKSVGREKLHIEAFLRFQRTKDEILFANVAPDFDVLPLISKHFRSRYVDQQWLIYDVKRKYGIFYDLEKVEIISLDLPEIKAGSVRKNDTFSGEEYNYQDVWNNYFKSTNIKSRVNKKVRTPHLPKRYSRHLSVKREAV